MLNNASCFSFSEVRYTYDQTVLLQIFGELFDLLKQLTKRHLSPKVGNPNFMRES